MAQRTNNSDEVIDLTDSFILVNHCAISDAVIEVLDTDESFQSSPNKPPFVPSIRNKSVPKKKSRSSIKVQSTSHLTKENKEKKLGECPICYDPLGKRPLAATKCGHVFCMHCLKQCLVVDTKCPTCRTSLKKTSSYHPLYF